MPEYRCPNCDNDDKLAARFCFTAWIVRGDSPDLSNVNLSQSAAMDEFTAVHCEHCGLEGDIIEFMAD